MKLIDRQRWPILWALAWPSIMEQILGTLVSFVDTAMVGALGARSTAAVSICAASIWLVNGVLSGVGVGYSVQVANAVGAGDQAKARAVIRQSVLGTFFVGILAMAAMELLAGHIPVWLGGDAEVVPQAVSYLRFYSLSLPFAGILAVFSPVLRCMGDSKTPLVLNTAANVLNIIFNFFFIYSTRTWHGVTIPGFGMGVAGAAVGSVLALAAAGLFELRLVAFNKARPISCSPDENYRPDPAIIRQAVRLGLPYIGERVTVNLGQIFMTRLVAWVGTVALAANHIATTAEGLCYLPAYGISFAATALVGQAVGARSAEDAKAYGSLAARTSVLLTAATAVCLFLFASPLARLFTADRAVIDQTALVLRIVSVSEPCFTLSIVLSGALRGAHDVRYPMFVCLGSMWGVRAILAPVLIFVFHLGLAGVWTAMAADLILRGVLCSLRWTSGRWQKHSGLLSAGPAPKN